MDGWAIQKPRALNSWSTDPQWFSPSQQQPPWPQFPLSSSTPPPLYHSLQTAPLAAACLPILLVPKPHDPPPSNPLALSVVLPSLSPSSLSALSQWFDKSPTQIKPNAPPNPPDTWAVAENDSINWTLWIYATNLQQTLNANTSSAKFTFPLEVNNFTHLLPSLSAETLPLGGNCCTTHSSTTHQQLSPHTPVSVRGRNTVLQPKTDPSADQWVLALCLLEGFTLTYSPPSLEWSISPPFVDYSYGCINMPSQHPYFLKSPDAMSPSGHHSIPLPSCSKILQDLPTSVVATCSLHIYFTPTQIGLLLPALLWNTSCQGHHFFF